MRRAELGTSASQVAADGCAKDDCVQMGASGGGLDRSAASEGGGSASEGWGTGVRWALIAAGTGSVLAESRALDERAKAETRNWSGGASQYDSGVSWEGRDSDGTDAMAPHGMIPAVRRGAPILPGPAGSYHGIASG